MSVLAQSAVVAAFVDVLRAAPALVGIPIVRAGGEPIPEGVEQAIVVRKTNSEPNNGEILGHPVDWVTLVEVDCYARAVSGQSSDEASDPLLMTVHDVLAADPSLQGAVDDIGDPALSWDQDEKDTALGVATATYRVQHRTAYRSIGV